MDIKVIAERLCRKFDTRNPFDLAASLVSYFSASHPETYRAITINATVSSSFMSIKN